MSLAHTLPLETVCKFVVGEASYQPKANCHLPTMTGPTYLAAIWPSSYLTVAIIHAGFCQ